MSRRLYGYILRQSDTIPNELRAVLLCHRRSTKDRFIIILCIYCTYKYLYWIDFTRVIHIDAFTIYRHCSVPILLTACECQAVKAFCQPYKQFRSTFKKKGSLNVRLRVDFFLFFSFFFILLSSALLLPSLNCVVPL